MQVLKINGIERLYPNTTKEIKLSQFVDFTKALAKVTIGEDMYENTVQLATCLAAFWGITLDDLAEVRANIETTEDFITGEREIKEWASIAGLVAGISRIIEKYVPEPLTEYEYKGRIWKVPHFKVSEFAKDYLRPEMAFGALMKLNEAKRVAFKTVGQKDKNGNDLDPEGNAQYTEFLYIVSYLSTNDEVDPFVTEVKDRIEYFKDIDMKIALDLYFFLISIQIQSFATRNFTTSSTRLDFLGKVLKRMTQFLKLKKNLK